MARTKSTARKTGPDPRGIPEKILRSKGKQRLPSKPKPIMVSRRFSQGVRALREIRKAMKAMTLAIPKLPFQRLCRDICDRYSVDFRWQRTALDCIHEAAEDFLIEFLQDSYICAAHAHRVTLMDKDLIVLRRLRYRFSKVLEPVPYSDVKTFNILNIPPARKPKVQDEVKVEDVTHEKDTRTHEQSEKKAKLKAEKERRKEQVAREKEEHRELQVAEADLPDLFNVVNPNGFLVSCFLPDDIGKREDYLTLDRESVAILGDKIKEVNDTVLLAACKVMMHAFPLNIQQKVEILDPSISHYLRSSNVDVRSLTRWTHNMDFETVELIMIPYNER